MAIEVTQILDNVTGVGLTQGSGPWPHAFSGWIAVGGRGGDGMVKVSVVGANDDECSWVLYVKHHADDTVPAGVFGPTSPPTANGASLTVATATGINYDNGVFEWTGKLWTHVQVILLHNAITTSPASSTGGDGVTRTHGTSAWVIAGDPATI